MEKIQSIRSVNLIGTGNVAWVLGTTLKDSGIAIRSVSGRNRIDRDELSNFLKCPSLALEEILPSADLILLAVSDDAIAKVSSNLAQSNPKDRLIAHTSGSKATTLLEPFTNRASFYPLQTMTKGNIVNFKTVPFCVYATNSTDQKALQALAGKISDVVHLLDDQQRATLHLSAVLVNNFANLFFTEAHRLSKSHNIDFELLRPLITKTAQKASKSDPATVQTGPAARKDLDTISQHLAMLENDPQLQELYKLVSERIIKNADSK